MIDEITSSKLALIASIAVATLVVATMVRLAILHGRHDEQAVHRRDSLKTWWVVILLIVGTAIAGRDVAVVVFAVVSLLAYSEWNRMLKSAPPDYDRIEGNAGDRRGIFSGAGACFTASYLLILAHYACLWLERGDWLRVVIPVGGILLVSTVLVVGGRTKGFIALLARNSVGLILTCFFLSHVVLLFQTPTGGGSSLDAGGWFLYLLALTELDDIVQALVGRRMGKRHLAPMVSPNKTWEGFFGGMIAISLLSVFLGPYLTSMTPWQSLASAVMIAISGLLGDLNMSAIKRDVGVKDSGNWLPGQGGLLDRIDSLTFTAPLFYFLFARSAFP